MAKAMNNPTRREERLIESRVALVKAALDAGKFTKRDICQATDLTLHDLNNLFARDKDIAAEFKVRRKTIVDIAADNLHDILNDKNHPQHFQATKYVLQTYKSDLDDALESQDSEEMSIEIPSSQSGHDLNNSPAAIIRFTDRRSRRESEEED